MIARRARRAALLLALALSTLCQAGDESPETGVAGAFSAPAGRLPRPGEWMEYRVAFPVDPLENLLAADPVEPPLTMENDAASAPETGGWAAIRPTVEPKPAWRTLPLRLEMRDMDDDGFNAVVTFAGVTRQVRIPFSDPGPKADFHYDDDPPPPERTTVRLGDADIEVETETRRAGEYGYARQTNPDLPFGLFRFATENVDLILVGTGRGQPPEFPMRRSQETIRPPAGTLFR